MTDDISRPTTELTRQQRLLRRLRGQMRRAAPFLLAFLGAFSALLLYTLVNPAAEPMSDRHFEQRVQEVMAEATPPPAYANLVYQIILPSLVLIQTEAANPFERDLSQAAFEISAHGQEEAPPDDDRAPESESRFGIGSGVVVNDQGAILTALHVVAYAEVINITFADGTRTTAQIVVAEAENDIAVLQAATLPELFAPATLGSLGAMRVGDEAFVVGNPLGLTGSMSAGVISGFERRFTPTNRRQALDGLIQFDAAVNPGASGGPLLNRAGQVIGIVTGLVNPAEEEAFAGIGLAVPISTAGGAAGAPNQ